MCGDYSGVHSELSIALKENGHEVTVISDGDGYKKLNSDIKVNKKFKKRSKIVSIFLLVLDYLGFLGCFEAFKVIRNLKLGGYDVIQLINPVVVGHLGAVGNLILVRHLKKSGGKVFLCALGDDRQWVSECLKGTYKYSALDKLSFKTLKLYYYSLKYLYSPAYVLLDWYVNKISVGVITSLYDYEIAYSKKVENLFLVGLPVSTDKYYKPAFNSEKKIQIFNAWQKGKENKKGNDILDAAAKIILKKYGQDKVEYVVASGMAYDDFIKSYKEADIYLDQVYSYDRGMSAVLAMAAGKCVFSGFEIEEKYSSTTAHNIKHIGVNAIPDIAEIVKLLSYLIENPEIMNQIRLNAYDYALNNNNSRRVAEKYINIWMSL